jgi:hypothetical protein
MVVATVTVVIVLSLFHRLPGPGHDVLAAPADQTDLTLARLAAAQLFQTAHMECQTAEDSDRIPPTRFQEFPGGYVARPSSRLSTARLREWARTGADAALKQLRAEIIAIERTFPELALPKTRRTVSRTIEKARKRGRAMSAAARKAVSRRMKKYWAERRKAKGKVK